MISLRSLFGRIAGVKPAEPVFVPFSAIQSAFHLDDDRYFANRNITQAFGNFLKFNIVDRVSDTRSFYIDPDERFSITLPTSVFSDIPGDELSVRGSAGIATQQVKTFTGKNKFAAMIMPRVASLADLRTPVAFGITGTVEPGNRFRVESVFMPKMDGRASRGLEKQPVTQDNVRLALHFACLCAGQMFGGQDLDCFGNLFEARRGGVSAPPALGP
jgi:hypothetical protein